jgi:hypothetical protein
MQADQGWQSSGITVDPGRTYELTASGRFQVHDVPDLGFLNLRE